MKKHVVIFMTMEENEYYLMQNNLMNEKVQLALAVPALLRQNEVVAFFSLQTRVCSRLLAAASL